LSEKDKDEILKVLETQRIYWNKGNIEAYMEGYWKSDSLRFIGKRGINFGWNNTLESYKKGYPDKETMGNLTFQVISLEALSNNTAFMIGKWDLDRKEKAGGYFTLIWKKLNGKWLITVDHTS
jgi:ketosteroid isomerase-like protein